MIFSSIRWRLQAWHGALLTAVVAGFGFTAHRLAATHRLAQIDEQLQSDTVHLGIALPPEADASTPARSGNRPPPPPRSGGSGRAAPARETGNLTEQVTSGGAWFVVWKPDGTVQAQSANTPSGIALTPPGGFTGHESHGVRTRGASREFFRYTQAGRCFLVGRDITSELAESRRLAWYFAAAGAGVLACAWLVGWWLSTRALRPIEQISATAEKIAAGDLSQRIDAAGFAEELRRLAGVLNSTFSRLDAAFAQQTRFTADAAHELRTPVSVMLMHSENGLACSNLTEEQREAFEASQRAARRMRRLIESLLELARFDRGQELIMREPFNLAQTARECADLVKPLADARGVEVRCEGGDALCAGDADRIGQVITNLLTNAIECHREHGEVRVTARRQDGSAILVVTDNGPGIDPGALPHIVERFYRADPSRANGNRRSGLGLAISKAIIEAHGGTIEAESQVGVGTTFTLRLPAAS